MVIVRPIICSMTVKWSFHRIFVFIQVACATMSSSDHSDQSGNEISDICSLPINPASLTPQDEAIERLYTRNGTRQFLVIDHSANQRSNSKISAIWDYGGERWRLDDKSMGRYWRCGHCRTAIMSKIDEGGKWGQISYAIRYLKNKYGIDLKGKAVIFISSLSIFAPIADFIKTIIASIATKGYKALISTLNVNRFRKALIIFFIIYNIAFNVVELSYYKKLLLAYLAEALELFLMLTDNTLKRLIDWLI
jgi:hypothetical protein